MEPTFEQELEVLIRARYPLLYVVSYEERRAEEILRGLAHRLSKRIYCWSLTRGYEPPLTGSNQEEPSRTKLAPEIEALVGLFRHEQDALYMLKDFHPFLGDVRTVRLLRDLAPRLHSSGRTLVLLSPLLKLPPELEKEITVVEMPLPTREEIAQRLREILLQVRDKPGVQAEISAQEFDELVQAAQGLTMDEIENVCARSFVEHRKLAVAAILSEKQQIVRKSGVLEYYTPTETMADVGGLDLLKEWLRKRRSAFTQSAREFGLPAPKGVLLLGVQGTGKSLSAKAIASMWNLPMLRLDVGRVFGSLVGASEANMRLAIRTAEAIAPCILWIDELEKGFSGVQSSGMSDSGTTARVFATFLTWMQEKRKPVFVVATANEVSLLPPELLRKGRFDEIFFIDLPSAAEREQIFAIHLRKRKRNPEQFDLKALARATEGFSGAEIEQVVIGALFTAFDAGRDLAQEDLLQEVKSVVPLSVMMREEIDELRTWAQMRTRPASSHAPTRKRNRI